MSACVLGVYWKSRELTLGAYAEFVRELVSCWRGNHAAFRELEWVGDEKHSPVPIDNGLRSLREIVYRHGWGRKSDLQGERNQDGTANWDTRSSIGFGIRLATAGSSLCGGGMSIGITGGIPNNFTFNSTTITFPEHLDTSFPYEEFYCYEFVLDLLRQLISRTKPDSGLFTSHSFMNLVYPDSPPDSGWLTYLADPRAGKLSSEFLREAWDGRGIIFTMGRDRVFDTSADAVREAVRFKEALDVLVQRK